MRIFRALINHAMKWLCGYKHDADDGQHHLAAVIWNATTLMYYERKAELDPIFAAKYDNRLDLFSIPNEDGIIMVPAEIIKDTSNLKHQRTEAYNEREEKSERDDPRELKKTI